MCVKELRSCFTCSGNSCQRSGVSRFGGCLTIHDFISTTFIFLNGTSRCNPLWQFFSCSILQPSVGELRVPLEKLHCFIQHHLPPPPCTRIWNRNRSEELGKWKLLNSSCQRRLQILGQMKQHFPTAYTPYTPYLARTTKLQWNYHLIARTGRMKLNSCCHPFLFYS